MNYGPRAMELGTQLIGLIFKKLLKLDGMRAWRLALGAWRLELAACSFLLGAWDPYPRRRHCLQEVFNGLWPRGNRWARIELR